MRKEVSQSSFVPGRAEKGTELSVSSGSKRARDDCNARISRD